MGKEKGKKRGKNEERKGKKRGTGIKKEKYPYFVFLLNIGPYERVHKKNSYIFFLNARGGGKDFSGWPFNIN